MLRIKEVIKTQLHVITCTQKLTTFKTYHGINASQPGLNSQIKHCVDKSQRPASALTKMSPGTYLIAVRFQKIFMDLECHHLSTVM